MKETIVKAKSISDLRKKLAAMQVLFQEVKIFATGYFALEGTDGEVVLLDTPKEVSLSGRKYITCILDGEMERMQMAAEPGDIWDTEFMLVGEKEKHYAN